MFKVSRLESTAIPFSKTNYPKEMFYLKRYGQNDVALRNHTYSTGVYLVVSHMIWTFLTVQTNLLPVD